MTLDTGITIAYGGHNGMIPTILNGSGCAVNEHYLHKHYEQAVKRGDQLLHMSVDLQNQRDDALATLDAAQSRIEELEEELARVEAARLRELKA